MNIARLYYINGDLQYDILLLLFISTLGIYILIAHFLNDLRPKFLLASLLLGIFFYSGFGIAYEDVNDIFVLHYILFIFCFSVPFLLCKEIKKNKKVLNSFDKGLLKNHIRLRYIAYFYLVLNLIPIIYPEFRLFDIFSFKDESVHVLRESMSKYPLIGLVDLLLVLIAPFFYAYFTVSQKKNGQTKEPLVLFILLIILQYGRFNYIQRNEIMTDAVNLILITFCVKGFYYKIKWRHIALGITFGLLMIPFLFLYTYYRTGNEYIGDVSYSTLLDLLTKSEFFYPSFYSDIIEHANKYSESIINFILYVICLPIPSAIFPGKPTYHAIETFTYLFTGMERGDTGFYILLPSILGESFIYGGEKLFWVFPLCSGLIISFIFKYLCTKKTLTFYTFYVIVFAFTYGRGGTMGLLPLLINGSLAIFIYDIYAKLNIKPGKVKIRKIKHKN